MSITASTLLPIPVAYFNVIKTITKYLARKYGTFERETSAPSLLGDRQEKGTHELPSKPKLPGEQSVFKPERSDEIPTDQKASENHLDKTGDGCAHAYPEQDEDHVFQLVRAHLMGYGWEGCR